MLVKIAFLFMIFSSLPLSGQEAIQNTEKEAGSIAREYLSYEFLTITGDTVSLSDYAGKVILIVNTASKCGYTPQYEGLEKLYRKYKDEGFLVLGFPANNFGNQEPGSNEQIRGFCTSRFDVTFPMMSKISVKGEDKHPLYVYLTEKSNLPGEITWNFNKFLLDKNGVLAARYESRTKPLDKELVAEIERLLGK